MSDENPSGMTKDGKDPKRITARQWMKRINRSLKFRDQVADHQNWKRIFQEYKGSYRVNTANANINSPPINSVYGYVHTAIPRIYFRDPHMSINPKGAESTGAARIIEIVIDYLFRELNLKGEVYRMLMDTFLFGHGWLKYGYRGEIGEQKDDTTDEVSEYIKDEEIFVTFVPYDEVVFDITLSKDPPHDCRWIAHRIIKPLREIKDDQSFDNTGNLRSNVTAKDTKGDKIDDTLKDSDLDLFEYWEVFDKDTKSVYCVANNMDKYLKEKPYVYEMKGFPFSMLKFNIVPGEPYPMSDIYLIEAQILERIKLRAAQINHIKRWSRQLSVEEGAMTPEEMEKFALGVDGAITQRKKGSAPPMPIQYAELQKESFHLDDLIQMDIDTVIGQNQTDRGGEAKTETHTAFELQAQKSGTDIRQAQRQDRLEDFLEEVTMKIISLVKQFQTTPRFARITGMDTDAIAKAFGGLPGVIVDANGIHFTKDAIQGDYDCEAKAGSTLPLNRENKIKLIESTLKIGPAIGIVPGSPTANALGKALFRELDMKDVEDAYDQQIQAQLVAPPPGGPAAPPSMPHMPPVLPPIPVGSPEAVPAGGPLQ